MHVILESARIDGAGEIQIFRKIILPNCKPILIAVGLFTFTGSWNDFLWPSIAINNLDRLTLTAGLQLAKGVYANKVHDNLLFKRIRPKGKIPFPV